MQCSICGKDNHSGSRFCVHCGAAQASAEPSRQSTVTAAMAKGSTAVAEKQPVRRASASAPSPSPAAPASSAVDAPATAARAPAYAADIARAAPAEMEPLGGGATTSTMATLGAAESAVPPAAPTVPAYDAAPRKRGVMAVIGLAVVALIGIAAFFTYQVSQDRERDAGRSAVAAAPDTTVAPPGTPPAPANQSAAPVSPAIPAPAADAPAAAATAPRADAGTPPAVPEPARTESATPSPVPAASAAATPTPTPALEPPAKTTPRLSAPRPAPLPKAATPARPVAPATTPSAEPAAPAPAPRPAQATAVRASTDRWAQMSDEMSRCTRENFINRVICDQRVRSRYCEGYWGKVAQCPGAATPDHGQ